MSPHNRNEAFYEWQYLTGFITLRDFKELVEMDRSMASISFDYAAIEEKLMQFKPGDKVRLKDSPYAGEVEPMQNGWNYVRFRTPGGHQITVSDTSLLVHDIDPKPGDIYEDNAGHEWIIIKQRGWSYHPEDFLAARCIDYLDYTPMTVIGTLALDKPEGVQKWADDYGVKLVRQAVNFPIGVITSVIGVDPGPTTGLCFLDYAGSTIVGRTSIQVDGESGQLVLESMLRAYYSDPETVVKRYAGIEAFVTGQGAGTRGDPADYTRQGVMKFAEHLQLWGYHTKIRKAADVKPWADDKKLKAAGILRPPEMRHANDAGRHALYAAVHDALRPNPLR